MKRQNKNNPYAFPGQMS